MGAILFDNQVVCQCELSQERSLKRFFPEGAAISPNPDYRFLADVYGGYGVKVSDPKAIQSAMRQAQEQVAQGRLALVDVVLSDYNPR